MKVTEPEAEWRRHLADGRFMIQRSASTGRHVFYPRVCAPGDGAQDLEWVPASGNGIVHAVTIVRKKDPADSYNVALVELAEGPRLMSRIDEAGLEAIRIGMKVKAKILAEGETTAAGPRPLLVFVPA